MRPLIRVGVILGASLWLAGCSLVFVNGPPETHLAMDHFSCTENRALPIIEGTYGGLLVLGAFAGDDESSDHTYSIVAGILGAIHGFSAITGFRRVSHCREAKELLRERLGNAGAEATAAERFGGGLTVPPPFRRDGPDMAGARQPRLEGGGGGP